MKLGRFCFSCNLPVRFYHNFKKHAFGHCISFFFFFFLGGGGGLRSYINIQNEPGMITIAGRKITRFTVHLVKSTSISRYIVSWICDTIIIVLSYHLKSINTVFQLTEKFVRIYKYILKIVKLSTILQK